MVFQTVMYQDQVLILYYDDDDGDGDGDDDDDENCQDCSSTMDQRKLRIRSGG